MINFEILQVCLNQWALQEWILMEKKSLGINALLLPNYKKHLEA
jgi:hypothetical protein